MPRIRLFEVSVFYNKATNFCTESLTYGTVKHTYKKAQDSLRRYDKTNEFS